MPDSPLQLPARPSLDQLRKQAKDLLRQCRAGDAAAAARVRTVIPRPADERLNDLALADMQFVLAREYGFQNWAALAQHVAVRRQLGDPHSAAYGMTAMPPFYRIDWATNTIEPRPPLSSSDWSTFADVMKALDTDQSLRILADLSALETITLWQTTGVTNAGVAALVSLPALRELTLDGLPNVTREAVAAFPSRVRVALSN